MSLSHRERVQRVLAGERPDRLPYAFWRHFYDQESSAQDLARAMVAWQREYDFDFLKVNPRAQYHVEPWGARFEYPGGPHDRPRQVVFPVRTPEELASIRPAAPDAGALGEQLEALRLIRRELGPEVPMVATIFNPLSVAADLVGSDPTLVRWLREHPAEVAAALEAITQTFIPFARACLEAGADGIFFATTTLATRNLLTEAEYARFGRPYDLRVLEAVRSAWFNILHVCQENSMLYLLADYPVPAVNWAATSTTNPSLGEARARLGDKTLIGGVSHRALTAPDPEAALAEARRAVAETGGIRFILGPDCSIPTTTRPENLRAVVEFARNYVWPAD